jgi:hypothetical protein
VGTRKKHQKKEEQIMETIRVDVQKLQLLSDRIAQTLEAVNQIACSPLYMGAQPGYGWTAPVYGNPFMPMSSYGYQPHGYQPYGYGFSGYSGYPTPYGYSHQPFGYGHGHPMSSWGYSQSPTFWSQTPNWIYSQPQNNHPGGTMGYGEPQPMRSVHVRSVGTVAPNAV